MPPLTSGSAGALGLDEVLALESDDREGFASCDVACGAALALCGAFSL